MADQILLRGGSFERGAESVLGDGSERRGLLLRIAAQLLESRAGPADGAARRRSSEWDEPWGGYVRFFCLPRGCRAIYRWSKDEWCTLAVQLSLHVQQGQRLICICTPFSLVTGRSIRVVDLWSCSGMHH
jgi:hypothetical protein